VGLPTPTKRSSVKTASAKPNRLKLISRYSKYVKRHHKRVVRYGLLFGNLAVVLVAVFIVVRSSGGSSANFSALSTAEEARNANPLDTVSASDVAANVALMTQLPEVDAIINDADIARANISSAIATEQGDTVLLPQVLSSDIKTKEDIVSHKVAEGETLEALANKYGVTSDSIRWSNGLTGMRLSAGTKLNIPPINGIVYQVRSGDTADSLASKYKVNAAAITRFNDAEITGLVKDDLIVIPDGKIVVAAPRYSGVASFAGSSYLPKYGGNGYVRGYCTWYVATRISVPNNWRNANTWDDYARRTPGWTVNTKPAPGSILQDDGALYGIYHVAYVEAVLADGSVQIAEMNAPVWNRETRRVWPASTLRANAVEFIHRQ
jgi:surface antigen